MACPRISLDGIWKVRPQEFACEGTTGLQRAIEATDGWIDAVVPGEIHLDLMRAGQMPEPSIDNNSPQCRWPETKSWWFRTSFDLDEGFLGHERQQLIFEGLDLYAQVFVNGSLVGEAANAFVPAVFDVRRLLQVGRNELVVRLTAGSELAADATVPGQNMQFVPNAAKTGDIPNPTQDDDLFSNRMWHGKKWLRKPQFAYGWDWVSPLPNIGIWRGVRLEARNHAVLDDIRLDTVIQGDQVLLEIEAVVENLHPWSFRQCSLLVEIDPPDGGEVISRRYELNAQPGNSLVRDTIDVPNPHLWWPNGMGDQPLYKVTARVAESDDAVCDERSFNIGLRTIDIDRSPLPEGSRFCIRVNGQDVFCRGGNIGPHDIIPARITDAKYEALVAEAINANMNMIRINGCSFYEAPAFYDACDRAGIMIWHDFMLTCTTYPDDNAEFRDAVRSEAQTVVKMLRHHASIALWCGNNECTMGFDRWWNPQKDKPLEIGGHLLYNKVLPDLCRLQDPHRPYWTGSPSGGEKPNSELEGDCHWWFNTGFMSPDVNVRISYEIYDQCRSRFVSEYGVTGPCHIDSIRQYLSPDQQHPDSEGWRVHTNEFVQGTTNPGIDRYYRDSESLSIEQFVEYGQMFQAIIHGRAMEALRFRKNDPADDCQGALIWSFCDCWGEMGWSILDYYLRRKASYYWFARACRPVKVIVRPRDGRLVTRIINDTLAEESVTVETGWWRLDGSDKDVASQAVTVLANDMLEVAPGTTASDTQRDPRQWIYAAVIRDADSSVVDTCNWPLLPYRQLALSQPEIAVKELQDDWIEITSPVFCHAVRVEDHGRQVISDNWFDLLPDVPVRVRVASDASAAELRFEAVLGKGGGCPTTDSTK